MLALVAGALLIGACGDSAGSSDDESTSAASTAAESTDDAPAAAADDEGVGGSARNLAPYGSLTDELLAALNAWLPENAPAPFTRNDVARELHDGLDYGTDGTDEFAFAGITGDLACQTDSWAVLRKRPDEDWMVVDVYCAGDIGPICRGTPDTLRAAWHGPAMARGCSGASDDEWGDISDPALDATEDGACLVDPGSVSIVKRRGTTCGEAEEVYLAWSTGTDAPEGWACFMARETDAPHLGSCAASGEDPEMSERAFEFERA